MGGGWIQSRLTTGSPAHRHKSDHSCHLLKGLAEGQPGSWTGSMGQSRHQQTDLNTHCRSDVDVEDQRKLAGSTRHRAIAEASGHSPSGHRRRRCTRLAATGRMQRSVLWDHSDSWVTSICHSASGSRTNPETNMTNRRSDPWDHTRIGRTEEIRRSGPLDHTRVGRIEGLRRPAPSSRLGHSARHTHTKE